MATNWWEIGKPVQDFEPVAQKKKEQNWWEIGKPVEEPAAQPVAAPPAPESTGLRGFGEGVAATFENIIPTIGERFKQFGFGVTSRAVDRLPDSINIPPPGVPIEEIDRAGGVREYYAQVYGINSDEDLRKVKEESQRRTVARVEASQQRVAELTPEDLNLVQRGVRGGVESLAVMTPAVLASLATRSPAPGLAGAGALEGFGSYAEARAEGKDPNAALAYGGVNAAIEVATELLPAGKLLDALNVKSAGELKKVLLEFAAREIPGEQAATALQSLNALAFGLDEELANAKTPEEFARIQGERQALTAISTIVAGGTQAAGIGAINKVREEVVRRDIETQVRDLEEVGSEMERQRINEIRTQALEDAQSIAAPQQNEIALDEGQAEPTPQQYGDNYAQKVYDSIGQYIPANAEFKVEQKVVDGIPRFVVTDREGIQYGQTLDDRAKADSFALSLNNTTKSRAELLKQLEPLQSSLKDTLKGFGLNDMGLTLSDRIFTRRGEALTSEGLFDPVVRRVFLAVDAIDPQGTLDTNQRREALRGVLRHEVVHALRYLDLWKRSEWKNLESTVSKLKKPGTDKTYLQIAQENYGDQNKVVQVEEGVADLIRDVAGNLSRVAGKPRSLSERAINFFDKAKNAVTGAGFQTYEDIVQRFEQGDIGARQRGRVRTFRATEEQQAARGMVPERLQRLFTNPEERNQFRQEVVQNLQAQVPVPSQPALNNLRLNAVRESRSTIDPVPPKIRVDEQEVPTRDSEGRLIYSGYEGPEVFGIQTRPTQEGLQNFWRWFGSSKVKDKQGRPQLFYHGTAADITEFRPKQAGSVFVTRSPKFAEEFSFLSDNYMVSNFTDFMPDQQVLEALDETLSVPNAFSPKLYDEMAEARREAVSDVQSGRAINPFSLKKFKDIAAQGRSSRYLNAIQKRLPSTANLMPVYVKADKPWDYDNKDDVKAVVKFAREELGADITPSMVEEIRQGNWQTIEGSAGNAPILDAIQYLGYDSMYVEEQGEKNLAVFNPGQIKSAVGNTGDFSPITPSIRESRKPVYNIINSRTGEVVGQANTIGGARRSVDRRDNQYGASVHTIQTVDPERDIAARNVARERLGLPPIERESRGVNIEVAPDPRDQAAVDTFNAFPENVRAEITTEVAEPVIRDTMRNLGIADYEVEYTLGGFQGGTQPSIIIRFGNAVPYNKMLEASKVLGTLWKQQAVIVYDENDKQGGIQTQFVKVIPSRKLSYDETKDLFKQIYDRYPEAAGFTGREGSLVFGNFSGNISPKDFHQGLDTALEDIDNDYIVTTTSDAFRSDWIEPVNLQGTQYESDTQRPVERGEVLRRQREFDSLQGRSDELFRAAVQKRTGAEAAPAEAALTPAARESRRVPRSSVSIFEMPDEEAKQTLGLEPGKNITRFVGERLNQRTLDEFGRIEDTDTSDSAAKQIADAMVTEVLYQLQASAQTGTGIGWYSNNYPRAVRRLARRFPELETDPNARSLFTAIVAITSNGEDVKQNISNAIKIYSGARKGQRLSKLSVSTRRSDSLRDNLKVLDTLIERYGIDGFSSILLEEMTVGEINAELRKLDEKTDSAYTADTVMPRAALYFGPKLGAFYSNLMGAEGYLTMDLWWSRMFNRLRGTLVPKPTQSSLDNVRGMLISIGRLPPSFVTGIKRPTDDDVIEAAVPFWESAKRKGYKRTTALEKSANTLIKAARLELEEAPFRASDRGFMIRTTRLAQDQLRNRGINLSLADIQAALWYYEKRLYGKLTGRATDDIGYEEAILNAAEGARPERSPPRFYRGSGRGAVSRGTGEAARRVVPTEAEIIPAAREARPTRAGPTQPGPTTDIDNTSAADALNMGEPINSMGVPTGPQITDTMPDGTVDMSRARLEPLTKRLIRGVEFIQSAPDKLRGGVGLGDIAKRIEDYYDGYAEKLGIVNGVIRDAFNQIPRRNRESALNTFEQYTRARENNRTEEAQRIFFSAPPADRQLISAWDQISRETGRINLSVTTPEGDPMKVWDSKVGAWRPIRAVQQFFPRTLRKEVMEVMKNPDLDPALWDSLLDSLVNAGRAENRQAAEDYLVREWFSDEIKQDYFAGVEKARSEPLPEIFYDYSWDAATRYLRKWARRTSQIENFGQELGQFKKDWFGTNIPKVRDQETQNYLNAIRERIYEIESFDTLTNIANWANSLATATQLGNPISASLNLLGGTITNVQEFGLKQIAKSYLDLALDWKNVQKEGTTLGILNKDFMNILSDHVEMDSDKYFSREQKISQALAKFANTTLTFGGFNGAENIVRASAMLAARSWLNDSLKAVNANPNSKRAKKFYTWVNRENLDANALILENGAGPETDKYMRRAVNVSQGSYQIDMTPVFIDTPAGRFLLKYQKFGTQINRFFYRHFLKPFMDEPTPANFLRIAGFIGSAVIGGGAILAVREAFGYGDPGPDDEEIKKALEKEDSERAWGLIFSRAWQNIMAAGSGGFFANYAQFAMDWQDQQRVKNPFSPPGLASVDAVIDVFNRLRDQGKLTARDLDEISENVLSFYRANKRIGLAALDTVGADYREVKRFAAQKEVREVREYGRRYSEEMEIEFKRSTSPGAPIRTPMTPTNKAIADALAQGDSARARLLYREAIKGLPPKEREKVKASVNASIRNRQPIQIGGNAPSQKERAEFLRWARQNLPAEKYQLILRADRRYRLAARRAGLAFSE